VADIYNEVGNKSIVILSETTGLADKYVLASVFCIRQESVSMRLHVLE